MCVPCVDTLVFGIRLLVSALCHGGPHHLIQAILNCYSKISWLPLNAALQQVHKIFFLVSIIIIMHVVINKWILTGWRETMMIVWELRGSDQ
jgi:hypothetical protein